MTELFGVPMSIIAAVSVTLAALVILFVAFIAVRNPVMFKMGLRNIPRRPAQTTLIVIGLMLSTLIITAAFGTGDTLFSSVTAEVYDILGEADEVIEWDADRVAAPLEDQVIPLVTVDEWRAGLARHPGIEAMVPFLSEILPVQDLDTRLNESGARIVAFRPEDAAALGGLRDVDGRPVELGPGEIAVNEALAELIGAKVGHRIRLFFALEPTQLAVVAIVRNEVLGGAFQTEMREGGAVAFETLAEITGKEGVADAIFVSNTGGVREGLERTDAAMESLEALVAGTPYKVTALKRDGIEAAKFFGSIFTTFFVVLGLFSIAAGVLLIFLIFVMLAAERQPEMGMARAVGAKRRQIVESFLAEGLGYDLGAAVVGLFAGMGVTLAMVAVLKRLAGDELGLTLEVSFTLRSLAVSFSLGLLATFLVIAVASWRASRLNIVAAIRDLPEAKSINPEDATVLGYLRAALNGVIALALPLGIVLLFLRPWGLALGVPWLLVGLVSPWLYVLRGSNSWLPDAVRTGDPAPRWPWVLGAILLVAGVGLLVLVGYAAALGLVRAVRNRRPRTAPAWLLAAGILVPPLGLVMAALQDQDARIGWASGLGFASAQAGVVLVGLGLQHDLAFPFTLGVSLLLLFVATTMRYFHVAERLAFTASSVVLLLFWYVTPAAGLERWLGELEGNIEMFFLSGFAMVTAGTFIVVYNADIILPVVAAIGSRFGRLIPAIKTAIAYPLTSRFRTGMTIAMIGLIVFALAVNATLNANFLRLFLNEDTKGGWDNQVTINSNNPVGDLRTALAPVPDVAANVAVIGENRVAFPFEAGVGLPLPAGAIGEPEYLRSMIIGADDTFIEESRLKLKVRARGYASDAAVWARLLTDRSAAVLPAFATASDDEGFGEPGAVERFRMDPLADGFAPFPLLLRDPSGRVTEVTVIGQMKEAADVFWAGIVIPKETLLAAFPESRGQLFYLKLGHGVDAEEAAVAIESTLVQASAESLQAILDEQVRLSNGFLLIFQGFMGLGLVVGLAALATIAFRNVVERRQQIGMLRAIGYKRGMIGLSFLFESGFTAAAGILLGLGLGLSLAWVLFTTGGIAEETKDTGFAVPWRQLGLVGGLAFLASLVMTVIPARQAAAVPVAEALRYE